MHNQPRRLRDLAGVFDGFYPAAIVAGGWHVVVVSDGLDGADGSG